MKHIVRPRGIYEREEGEDMGGRLADTHGLMRTVVGDGSECQGQQEASRGVRRWRLGPKGQIGTVTVTPVLSGTHQGKPKETIMGVIVIRQSTISKS